MEKHLDVSEEGTIHSVIKFGNIGVLTSSEDREKDNFCSQDFASSEVPVVAVTMEMLAWNLGVVLLQCPSRL